jgi:4-hydroxy-tetrahydrodipicolinate reductase
MKIALIGAGKTGQEIIPLLSKENIIGPFNQTHPFKPELAKEADAGIVFIPGEAFKKLYPLLLNFKRPLVIGSTGMSFDENEKKQIQEASCTWIWGTNFSLGVYLMRRLMMTVNESVSLLGNPKAELLDLHHTQKKDAPSGTAKSIQSWAKFPLNITSKREGDVVGLHELKLHWNQETITLTHEAHHRKIFAEGALRVAELCLKNPPAKGLTKLEDFLDQRIKL